MKSVNKRGLSPVIASVLLIALVLVLAAMIFLWARGFISEQIEKFGKPVEDLCASVDFKVERVGNDVLEVFNKGNTDIWRLDVKLFDESGNSEMSKFDVAVNAGQAKQAPVSLFMEDGSRPDKIIVYPALLGDIKGGSSRRAFTCMDRGFTLS